MMRQLIASLRRSTQAAAAAEMALMLPLLVAIMFGGVEGGAYLWTEHKVIKGVREGARYAGRQPFEKFDCATPSTTITDASVETAVKNVTRTGTADGTGAARVSGWIDSEVTVTVACDATSTGLYKQVGAAPVVTVAATVDYPSLFGSLGFDTTGAVVRAQSEAAVMGI